LPAKIVAIPTQARSPVNEERNGGKKILYSR